MDDLPSLESGWKRLDNGELVFSDPSSRLVFPETAGCSVFGLSISNSNLRAFTIAKVGEQYRLTVGVEGKTGVPINDALYLDKPKALTAFRNWYHKQRANEILHDANCDLETHGFRLKDTEPVPIKKQ